MTSHTYVQAEDTMHDSDLGHAVANPPETRTLSHENSRPDHPLLESIVQATLRLRLRGMDLESSTGLSGRELDLVALLNASGRTSVKSLVADLGLPRSTMTAIVDRLENRGLVKRFPNPADRRSVILEATPSANAALLRFRRGMLDLVQHLERVLSEDEQAQLVGLIGKIDGSF